MEKITVSRNDDVYEAFADIAKATDGTLVCTYRESMCHSSRPFSRIVVRRSGDHGKTWGPRQVICEATREQTSASDGRYNCPRITACADGTLLLVIDRLYAQTWEDYLKPSPAMNILYRSHDAGVTWDGPEETGITEGIVPSIKELSNGTLILGVTEQFESPAPGRGFSDRQTTYLSADKGATWDGPFNVPDPPVPTVNGEKWKLCEGDFAEMDDGSVVIYLREAGEQLSGWKSVSGDGGRTWSVPIRTQMPSCCGRPSVGRLRSGEVLVTYRISVGRSTSLAIYVESSAEAVRGLAEASKRDLEDYSKDAEIRFAVIDNDRSAWADSTYSGWVQLPDGDIYVVNYQNDDAPRAFIRGYRLSREDWYLFPEGRILNKLPYDWEGEYIAEMQTLSREQQEWVNAQHWSRPVPTHK